MALRQITIIKYAAVIAAAVGVCVMMAAGCRNEEAYEVTGTVSYRGKPLPRGMINFFGKDNRPRGGPIAEDGTFNCRLAPGAYDVTVTAPPIAPAGWKETEPLPEDDLKLPDKYALRRTSGLKARIEEDPQSLNFDLN